MPDLGIVYLVGAGPGDPELITSKGLRLIRETNVLVYDRLVSPDLVSEAPKGAELIDARAQNSNALARQDAINTLLIERAREGKHVVRLKGGDPFLFGRGGEEADALAAANIPFEIVPGVTSALAVPAYAGIPVTDRRFSSGLRIITGRQGSYATDEGPDRKTPRETIVALMMVEALPRIVAGLIKEGWPRETPVALIERGTTAQQRTIETTLEQAVEKAKEEKLQPPAIAVIGGVVQMRKQIAWFEEDSQRGLGS